MTNMRVLLIATSLLGGLAIVPMPAYAQAQGGAQARALQACGAIAKKSARLDCYDRLAQGIANLSAESSPAAVGAPASERAPAPTFGEEQIKTKRAPAAHAQQERITAEVASTNDQGIGHWIIALKDGAVWQMTEASPNFLPPRRGETIQIRKGALGGYLMDVRHQRAVSVRRLK